MMRGAGLRCLQCKRERQRHIHVPVPAGRYKSYTSLRSDFERAQPQSKKVTREFAFVRPCLRICRVRYQRKGKKGTEVSKAWKSEREETAVALSLILLEVVRNAMPLRLPKALSQSLPESVRLLWVTSANFNARLLQQIRLNPH